MIPEDYLIGFRSRTVMSRRLLTSDQLMREYEFANELCERMTLNASASVMESGRVAAAALGLVCSRAQPTQNASLNPFPRLTEVRKNMLANPCGPL
jgi:hypothetical protein